MCCLCERSCPLFFQPVGMCVCLCVPLCACVYNMCVCVCVCVCVYSFSLSLPPSLSLSLFLSLSLSHSHTHIHTQAESQELMHERRSGAGGGLLASQATRASRHTYLHKSPLYIAALHSNCTRAHVLKSTRYIAAIVVTILGH